MKKICIFLLPLLIFAVSVCRADNKGDAMNTVSAAHTVLNDMMRASDNSIPRGLLKSAHAIIIVPSMYKAGFILGGSYGRGVIISRLPDGKLSAPAFVTLGGASLGLQLGGQSIKLVLVVNTVKGLQGILNNSFTMGSNLSAAAGPYGRHSEVSLSAADANADIYSYSRSSGLSASVAVDGTHLSFDEELTQAYYGKTYNAHQILVEGKVENMPAGAVQLLQAIEKYVK